ncbi:DNA repair and recombination protein pif1 [Ceratobasidium theobromae]|uniref:ATP-dependent DNA helicase PIF1 n=1 Tax=Ceratobasidium theobromae TaxID=1582974 RepID=A0A5N5QIE1_9AGAM|nr:DNA repair and recombination protein pif1 [Ceratobasidium theobromae]
MLARQITRCRPDNFTRQVLSDQGRIARSTIALGSQQYLDPHSANQLLWSSARFVYGQAQLAPRALIPHSYRPSVQGNVIEQLPFRAPLVPPLPPALPRPKPPVEIWPEELFPPMAPRLSQEQEHVLNKVLEGESVFFTGSAGTGKSVLLRAIIQALGGPSDEVAVTASTGIAAVNIGGQTLHSFAGVGLGKAPMELLIKRAKQNPLIKLRWLKVKVLIIDEISMVDAVWFDCLDELAQKIRKIKQPFGGIQLVVCGDFFQLPPVPDRGEGINNAPASFVFDSFSWDNCIKTKISLTQVFRQKDPQLVKLLNDAREGVVSPASAALLRSLSRPIYYPDNIGPTEIYPTREQANQANMRQLDRLPGDCTSYISHDAYGKNDLGDPVRPERAARLLAEMIVPKRLQVKVGAQVMCVRNVSHMGVVNGSAGRVVGFMRPAEVRGKNDSQWRVVSSLELAPRNENDDQLRVWPTRVSGRTTRSKREREAYEDTEWPVVEFPGGIYAMMGPVLFTVETRQGTIEARRLQLQVPLILAWALTVHKSQGQTLDRVKIDLKRTFEKGQAYVALSRCTSLDGLEVYNFDEKMVVANPRRGRSHMALNTWYAVYHPDSLSTVLRSPGEVETALKACPSAQVELCKSFEQARQWLEGQKSPNRRSTIQSPSVISGSSGSPSKGTTREIDIRNAGTPGKPILGAFSLDPTNSSNPARAESDYEYDIDDDDLDSCDLESGPLFILGKAGETGSGVIAASEQKESTCMNLEASSGDSDPFGDIPLSLGLAKNTAPRPAPPTTVESGFLIARRPGSGTAPTGTDAHRASPECLPPPTPLAPAPIALSQEQQDILDRVCAGESLFFTGAAGTGKSVLLSEIIEALEGPSSTVAVTASTGIAALNIGGQTLHSFAGESRRLGNKPRHVLIKMAKRARDDVLERWRETRVLIIDEVSMVGATWFDDLEAIARSLRGNSLPFGGIQLVACGDFFQLPPVPNPDEAAKGVRAGFAFEAKSWNRCIPTSISLTQVFRQKQPEFIRMLNDMRLGHVSDASNDLLISLSRPLVYEDGIRPTEIFPLRRMVNARNQEELDRLESPLITFTGRDTYLFDMDDVKIEPHVGKEILDRIVPFSIELKVGAQVMCTRNLKDIGLVNGSLGKVVDFKTPRQVREMGETQGYSQDDTSQPETHIMITDSENEEYHLNRSKYEGENWPVVQYTDGTRVIMYPVEFTSERPDGETQASRQQVPLILAWAITTHKAQGQTLDRVKVDLNGTFEKGQAYVALSRCTTLEGLQVLNYSPAYVVAHHRVIWWSQRFYDYGARPDTLEYTPPGPRTPQYREQRTLVCSPISSSSTPEDEWGSDEEDIAIQMYHSP